MVHFYAGHEIPCYDVGLQFRRHEIDRWQGSRLGGCGVCILGIITSFLLSIDPPESLTRHFRVQLVLLHDFLEHGRRGPTNGALGRCLGTLDIFMETGRNVPSVSLVQYCHEEASGGTVVIVGKKPGTPPEVRSRRSIHHEIVFRRRPHGRCNVFHTGRQPGFIAVVRAKPHVAFLFLVPFDMIRHGPDPGPVPSSQSREFLVRPGQDLQGIVPPRLLRHLPQDGRHHRLVLHRVERTGGVDHPSPLPRQPQPLQGDAQLRGVQGVPHLRGPPGQHGSILPHGAVAAARHVRQHPVEPPPPEPSGAGAGHREGHGVALGQHQPSSLGPVGSLQPSVATQGVAQGGDSSGMHVVGEDDRAGLQQLHGFAARRGAQVEDSVVGLHI
mmetsp:Transcript_14586/g.32159  ORF Transcript_14586/g.32159 Transcript_14586/m.32159 type:complete len:384 (+) Transcript_14586:461-1612(+)